MFPSGEFNQVASSSSVLAGRRAPLQKASACSQLQLGDTCGRSSGSSSSPIELTPLVRRVRRRNVTGRPQGNRNALEHGRYTREAKTNPHILTDAMAHQLTRCKIAKKILTKHKKSGAILGGKIQRINWWTLSRGARFVLLVGAASFFTSSAILLVVGAKSAAAFVASMSGIFIIALVIVSVTTFAMLLASARVIRRQSRKYKQAGTAIDAMVQGVCMFELRSGWLFPTPNSTKCMALRRPTRNRVLRFPRCWRDGSRRVRSRRIRISTGRNFFLMSGRGKPPRMRSSRGNVSSWL